VVVITGFIEIGLVFVWSERNADVGVGQWDLVKT